MRDLDQALARVYGARKGASPEAATAPPPPHFTVEAPRYHGPDAVTLVWPETVRTLERAACGPFRAARRPAPREPASAGS